MKTQEQKQKGEVTLGGFYMWIYGGMFSRIHRNAHVNKHGQKTVKGCIEDFLKGREIQRQSLCAFRITVEVSCLEVIQRPTRQFLDPSSASVAPSLDEISKNHLSLSSLLFLLLFFFRRPQKRTFFRGEPVVDSRPPSRQTLREMRGSDSSKKPLRTAA
ncbi:hypothetical protein NL108_016142 [Boleophthalmus pectinirostris]|nr:hypothetical protein NL108_016142 [Boleophthalmus pectinirostris]